MDDQNKDLLAKLRSPDAAVYELACKELYQRAYKMCASYVFKNSGDETDAGDAFRDALIIFITKLRRDPGFVLTSRVESYLYGVTMNVWRKQLEKRQRNRVVSVEQVPEAVQPEEPSESVIFLNGEDSAPVGKLLPHVLQVLQHFGNSSCRQVLSMFYIQRVAIKDIAATLGYSEAYTKKKKSNCLEYMRSHIVKTFVP